MHLERQRELRSDLPPPGKLDARVLPTVLALTGRLGREGTARQCRLEAMQHPPIPLQRGAACQESSRLQRPLHEDALAFLLVVCP